VLEQLTKVHAVAETGATVNTFALKGHRRSGAVAPNTSLGL